MNGKKKILMIVSVAVIAIIGVVVMLTVSKDTTTEKNSGKLDTRVSKNQNEEQSDEQNDFVAEFMERWMSNNPYSMSVYGKSKSSNFEDNIFTVSFYEAINYAANIQIDLSKDTTIHGTIDTDIEDMVPIFVNLENGDYQRLDKNGDFEVNLSKGSWCLLYVGKKMKGSVTVTLEKNKYLTVYSA